MASPGESATPPPVPGLDGGTTAFHSLWSVLSDVEFLVLEVRMVLSALAIIFLGAHGALRRPPSASPPERKDGKPTKKGADTFTEGFVASDAILFPVAAGAALVGMYYLIKWLQDPAILNKILRSYISVMAIASVGKLFADSMQFATSFVFPAVWRDRHGQVFRVDQQRRGHVKLEEHEAGQEVPPELDPTKKTPLPGWASEWSLAPRTNNILWEIRHLLLGQWTLEAALHGAGKTSIKFRFASSVGLAVGLVVAYAYHLTNSPLLSNLVALGTCYGAFMIVSCTSFSVGSLVLMGLFVYDVVMVFYTPFMIAVATKVDAPIKLVFSQGPRASLLGLGDIVVPGMFICLALRFDLYRHYQKKITYVPTDLQTVAQGAVPEGALTTTQTKHRAVKAPFVSPRGRWGDRCWTSPWVGKSASGRRPTHDMAAGRFPKPYFYATLAGYLVGMVATLVVLFIFRHGQPALLYLVPGVVGSAWLTGLWRGELQEMWTYTEDGSLDTKDVVVELDGEGRVVKETEQKKEGKDDEKKGAHGAASDGPPGAPESQDVERSPEKTASAAAPGQGYYIFRFSLQAPGPADVEEDDE